MKYPIIIFLLFCQFARAQSAESSKAIRSNFSNAAISAYQESSSLKLQDFYQYLEILSDSSSTQPLKDQVRENVYAMVSHKKILITDFTVESGKSIDLNAFLDKIEGQNLKFSLTNLRAIALSSDSWTYEYSVEILGTAINSKIVRQKIYFAPELKSFGKTQKQVWAITIGEME